MKTQQITCLQVSRYEQLIWPNCNWALYQVWGSSRVSHFSRIGGYRVERGFGVHKKEPPACPECVTA